MKRNSTSYQINARAALSSYIVLAGVWLVLGFFWLILSIRGAKDGYWATGICFSVTLTWVIWLRGFRIRINDEKLEYRDGLYKLHIINLENIKKIRIAHFDLKVLMRRNPALRLVIERKGRDSPLLINIKPFRADDLQEIRKLLEPHVKKQ